MTLLVRRKLALVEPLLHHGLLTLPVLRATGRSSRLRSKEVVVLRLRSMHLLTVEVLALLLQLSADVGLDLGHLVRTLDHVLELLFVARIDGLRQVLRL